MSVDPRTLTLPVCVLAALWLPTVRDEKSAIRAARAIRASESPPRIHQLPDQTPPPQSSTDALAAVLTTLAPVREVAAVLPRPGDLMGAPASCSADLLEAGEGILVRTGAAGPLDGTPAVAIPHLEVYGSVMETGELVSWQLYRLDPDPATARLLLGGIESASHARREVTRALAEAVEVLETLDVARERPDLAEQVLDLSLAHLDAALLPPGLDGRTLDLLERSARLLAIVELAQSDPGAAVTALSIDTRAGALGEIARHARHALAAASAHRA